MSGLIIENEMDVQRWRDSRVNGIKKLLEFLGAIVKQPMLLQSAPLAEARGAWLFCPAEFMYPS